MRVRFVAGDGTTAARAAAAAASAGGLVVVLDARTGEVLHALAPGDIDGGRISLHGLRKQGAEQVVDGYVTAATGH